MKIEQLERCLRNYPGEVEIIIVTDKKLNGGFSVTSTTYRHETKEVYLTIPEKSVSKRVYKKEN